MKLYIWNEPYHVAFGSTLIFAVAHNLGEARKMVKTGKAYTFGDCKEEQLPFDGTLDLGKPTRIVELPCAEWHRWSE